MRWLSPTHFLGFLPRRADLSLLYVTAIAWRSSLAFCSTKGGFIPVATCFVLCSFPLPMQARDRLRTALAKGGFILC